MKNIGYSFNGFTTARLKRFLNTGGRQFLFIETGKNEYGEPDDTLSKSVLILGVLHESSLVNSGMGSITTSANAKTRTLPGVSIITSWESLSAGFSGGKELSPEMLIKLGESWYKIIKTSNLNDWGIVAEIFLEEIDEWKN